MLGLLGATFLQTHKEYRLQSFLDSNCFLVANRKSRKRKIFVSLFKQTDKEISLT